MITLLLVAAIFGAGFGVGRIGKSKREQLTAEANAKLASIKTAVIAAEATAATDIKALIASVKSHLFS